MKRECHHIADGEHPFQPLPPDCARDRDSNGRPSRSFRLKFPLLSIVIMSKEERNVHPSHHPTQREKGRKERKKGKEGREGGGIDYHSMYLLKSTFLDVSGFSSGVLRMIGRVVK